MKVNKLTLTALLLPLVLSLVSTNALASTAKAKQQNKQQNKIIVKGTEKPHALTPFNAKYKVNRGRMSLGQARRQLSQIGDNKFSFSYVSDLSFLILSDYRKESSELTITNNLVQPLKYLFKREGTGSDSETILAFDPATGNIKDIKLDRQLDCAQQIHWQDQISYQLQLKLDLEAGKQGFEYYLVDDDKREKHYKFEIIGKEQLTTPAGTFETIKIQRVRENSKRLTELWMSPAHGYLLVRLRQEKDGSEQVDVQLASATFNAI